MSGTTGFLKSDGTGNLGFLRSANGLANGNKGAAKGSTVSRASPTPILKNLFLK